MPSAVLGASRSLLLSHGSSGMTAWYRNEAGEAWKGFHLPKVAAAESHNWDLNWNLLGHPIIRRVWIQPLVSGTREHSG